MEQSKISLQNAAKELPPQKAKKNVKNKTTEYKVINKEIVDECRQAKEN